MKDSITKRLLKTVSDVRRFAVAKRELLSDEVLFSKTHQFLHTVVLACQSFGANRGMVRAGALTFSSILALVPLLALVISISTGILQSKDPEEFRQNVRELTQQIIQYVAPQLETLSMQDPKKDQNAAESGAANRPGAPGKVTGDGQSGEPEMDAQTQLVDQIITFVNRVQSGGLAATSIMGLVIVALSMLITIESTFNDIWGISRGRSWISRLVQYWTVLTLGSLLLFVVMGSKVDFIMDTISSFYLIGPSLEWAWKHLFPIAMVLIAFSFIYYTTPNTRVQFKAAVVGGAVGALLWKLNTYSSAVLAATIMRDKKIYEGFAVVPVFILGVYIFWLILLFGAQMAHAYQNRDHHVLAIQTERISQRGKEFVGFRIMALLAGDFVNGKQPPLLEEIAARLQVPTHLAQQLVSQFLKSNLLLEVVRGEESGYAPSRPVEQINGHEILCSLRDGQVAPLPTANEPQREWVHREIQRISQAEAGVAEKIILSKLAEGAPASSARRPRRTPRKSPSSG